MRTRSDRRCAGRAFAFVAVLVATKAAHADPTAEDDPKMLFAEGARLYDVGEYEHAIDKFQRAYVITGAPRLLLNIGQAHRLNGACALSAASYRRYLEKSTDRKHRPEVEQRVREMDECALAKESAAQRSREPLTQSENEGPATPPPRAISAGHERSSSTLGWVGVGVGAGGVVLVSAALGLTFSAKSRLDNVCAPSGGCPRSSASDLDDYERWRVVTVVGAATVAVGTAIAVVGFVRSSGASREAQSSKLTVFPYLSAGSAGVQGTFF